MVPVLTINASAQGCAATFSDAGGTHPARDWLLNLLHHMTHRQLDLAPSPIAETPASPTVDIQQSLATAADWEAVQAICGYSQSDFTNAGAPIPLTAAAAQHFCRNHRESDPSMAGQFESLDGRVPEALATLYSIYHTQTRLDAEAALFLAQSSGTTRVAVAMADLLAIGGFNHGDKSIHCNGRVFAVATAFDTANIIDAANHEARARLSLAADDSEQLLQLSPDDIGLIAAQLAAEHRLSPLAFLQKANLLAEARQDVNRFAINERFAIALYEGDLPISDAWVSRLVTAMRRIVPQLVGNVPPRLTQESQITA